MGISNQKEEHNMYYHIPYAKMLVERGFLEKPESWTDQIPEDLLRQAQDKLRKEEQRIRQENRMRMYRNPELFLNTPGLYVYDPNGEITFRELYHLYKDWCLKEGLPLQPARAFWLYIKKHAPQCRLVYSGNIQTEDGKRARGFYGIRLLSLPDRNG